MFKQINPLFAIVAVAVALTACAGDAGNQVASLTETTTTDTVQTATSTEEDPLLDFAQCMREQGLDEFADPIIEGDGKVEFPSKADEGTTEQFEVAFAICASILDGTSLGADKATDDALDAVDQLVAFSECVRAEGLDVPDPNADGSFPEFDKDSEDFAAAWEACGAIFEGSDSSGK